MERITVKLDRRTHQRLIAAQPELSAQAGLMLTISEAIEYLMANHHADPCAKPGVPAGWSGPQLGGADAQT